MYQNIATKVLTGEVRLSYVNLTTPRAPQQGGEPKYSVTLLIPKTDAATIADINASIKAAYEAGVASKWAGKHPTPKQIVHDGDGLRPSGLPFGDECKGHWVLTASTKSKPQVVGIDNLDCELAPSDIYSGMYARVTINFFTYVVASVMCSKPVTVRLLPVVHPQPATLRGSARALLHSRPPFPVIRRHSPLLQLSSRSITLLCPSRRTLHRNSPRWHPHSRRAVRQ